MIYDVDSVHGLCMDMCVGVGVSTANTTTIWTETNYVNKWISSKIEIAQQADWRVYLL